MTLKERIVSLIAAQGPVSVAQYMTMALHDPQGGHALPWKLLGIHSGRLDMSTRQPGVDESLGLNCAWYADILWTLTQ